MKIEVGTGLPQKRYRTVPSMREEILHIMKTQIPSLVLHEGKYCVLARTTKATR